MNMIFANTVVSNTLASLASSNLISSNLASSTTHNHVDSLALPVLQRKPPTIPSTGLLDEAR